MTPTLATTGARSPHALTRLRSRRTPHLAQKSSATAPLIAFNTNHQPVWSPRDYAAFAREGFMQNAIVYRSVRMIAEAAASVPLLLYAGAHEIEDHPLLDLLRQPNPVSSRVDLLEAWYGYLLVSGNAYLEAVALGSDIRELHTLRPDRMKVVPGPEGYPEAYDYSVSGQSIRLAGEPVPGVRRVLHMKLFHPADDHYGLSPIEAAATAIDTHNTASRWNKALLDNSARPSGALVYTARDGNLSGEQYERLKRELESGFQGAGNSGRPLLLEGGLDWKAMSLSPKDMDFLEAKHTAAREIALALGVPPMLLAIPGDNTFSNYQEANRTFWRQTVIPLVQRTADALSSWLAPAYAEPLTIKPDLDSLDALSSEREALWTRLEKATFLTTDEKRAAIGYGPMPASTKSDQPDLSLKYPGQPRTAGGLFDFGKLDAEPIAGNPPGARPPSQPPRTTPRRPGIGNNGGPPLDPPGARTGAPPSIPFAPSEIVNMYRGINNMPEGTGTVAVGDVDGSTYIGVNSRAPGYTDQDREDANKMRGILVEKYPDVMKTDNIGQKPNDAVYHAEATLLLRAARQNGGSLAGKSFDMYVDNEMCDSCETVLPKLARELGYPTIRFKDHLGRTRTLSNGQW